MEQFPTESGEVLEESDEDVFRSYVEDLELQPEDFKKKILDVGSGTGQFAKWSKEHGVSSDIVSVEPYKEIEGKSKGVKADAVNLPFTNDSFELVVSDGAIPHIFLGQIPKVVKDSVRKSLEELVRVTAPGGEIRLGRVLMGDVYKNQRIVARAIHETLRQLERSHALLIKQIHKGPDTYEYDESGKIPQKLLAHSFLFKIKKPHAKRQGN